MPRGRRDHRHQHRCGPDRRSEFELGRSAASEPAGPLPPHAHLDGLTTSAGDTEFALGLEWLMDGLAARIADEPGRPSR